MFFSPPKSSVVASAHSHRFWDRLGMGFSTLCAVHCAATPLLLLAFPLAGELMENELIHWGLAAFVIPIGAAAFYQGYRHHRQSLVPVLGGVGLLLIAGALLLPEGLIDELLHHAITLIGSLFLIAAHWRNRRACRHH